MPLHVSIGDAVLRVVLAFLGAALVGFNREERNESAGMRTTILVCLAACIVTLLANLLLNTTGKDQHHFSQIDVLRLPLGILSGIGFIGAGAIIKKDDIALGVTTAATMWFISVVGIVFGAGQFILGSGAVALALFTLWALKWFDKEMPRAMRATLEVHFPKGAFDEAAFRHLLEEHHFKIKSLSTTQTGVEGCLQAIVQWEGRQEDESRLPPIVGILKQDFPGKLIWKPASSS
jgi:putative Mg2+ transporter-C (MgtC) family protein